MAIAAKFEADFQSFQSAVAQAEVSLRSFEQGGAKVESQLNRVTNSLSGTKIIQEATIMAEAVEKIGGVSALSERELKRLGATANEAVEKMTKLGVDVPPGIQRIADASAAATKSAFDWRAALTGVAGVVGVAFSVNAIKNFAVGVIDLGASIGDMAVKLDVSAEAIQRWKYAAEQSGTTIDVVEKSIAFMNKTLAEGNKSTVAALEAAGLSFSEIRKMSPEEAFNAITDAVGKIEDPMTRAKVATELFGRAGQDLLPAMVEGFRKVGAEVRVMSDETVARLKAAQDAWSRLSTAVTIHTGEMIASIFKVTTNWKEFTASLATALVPGEFGRKMQSEIVEVLDSLTGSTIDMTKTLAAVPPAATSAASGLKPVAMSAADVDATIKHLNITVANSATALAMVEPKVGSLDKAIKGFKENNEAMNLGLRFTSEVIGELPPKIDAMAASLHKVADAQKAVTASKDAPGSVAINTAGISVGNFDAAFKAYNNIYKTNGNLGAIGGGPAPDFLSWAMRSGFAARGMEGGGGASTVNVNGILMGNDPGARDQLLVLVNDAVRESLRGQGARVGA